MIASLSDKLQLKVPHTLSFSFAPAAVTLTPQHLQGDPMPIHRP
jgi:hypothetical protein